MNTPCPLCHQHTHDVVGKPDETFTLARCRTCGFVFADPRPSPELLMEFYNRHSDYNTDPPSLTPEKARKRAEQYAGFIRSFHPGATKILEIGCLHAHMLFGLRQWGYDVQGADICERSRQFAATAYDIRVHEGETPAPEQESSYDVLIISHVIEHILDPVSFLRQAARFLAPDGIMIVETPGLDTPIYKLFKASYNMVRPPEHISFFDARTLGKALEAASLAPVKTLTYSYLWDQKNIFFYGALSFFKALGVLSTLRRKQNPSTSFGLAAPIAVKNGSPFDMAVKALDYGCRLLNLALYPLTKRMDAAGLGLMLVAIGRKKG